MAYHSSVPEKAKAYRKKIVERFEVVKTAHKEDMNLTSRPKFSIAAKDFARKPQYLRAPKNIIPVKTAKERLSKTSEPKLDVQARREAKLEEYRQQKLKARKY